QKPAFLNLAQKAQVHEVRRLEVLSFWIGFAVQLSLNGFVAGDRQGLKNLALIVVQKSNLFSCGAAKKLLQGANRAFAVGSEIINAFNIGTQEPHDSLPVARNIPARCVERGASSRVFEGPC